jgi:hypothetical protein
MSGTCNTNYDKRSAYKVWSKNLKEGDQLGGLRFGNIKMYFWETGCESVEGNQ